MQRQTRNLSFWVKHTTPSFLNRLHSERVQRQDSGVSEAIWSVPAGAYGKASEFIRTIKRGEDDGVAGEMDSQT